MANGSGNITIRINERFKRVLEEKAKQEFISLSTLLKQGAKLWLQERGISKEEIEEILAEK